MKLVFKSADGGLTVEADPKSFKDAFEACGQINELLIPGPCGKCNSKSTYPQAKHTKDYVFYEHKCRDCGATFSFGQTKEGGRLFPKLTDKEGHALPNKGWSVYQANGSSPSGSFGSDGYKDPPSRQANEPAGRTHSSDDEVPF